MYVSVTTARAQSLADFDVKNLMDIRAAVALQKRESPRLACAALHSDASNL